jgi:hypothetical protein
MRLRMTCVLLVLAGISGCAGNQPVTAPTTPAVIKHVYNGTASVGDFITITVDTTALTISYNDISNGESGTVSYTVNTNGTYAIADPTGNLVAAYEVPGYALMIEATKTGPGKNTLSLITAVESGPISMSTFINQSYNYMQFRTQFGGMDVGSVAIAPGTGQTSNYWPYGNISGAGGGPFGGSTLDFSTIQEDSSGTFMTLTDPSGTDGTDYIFGTANGFFIVDTPNGSILGLKKAASKSFDPNTAGTYNAMFYHKTNASTGAGNEETGTASIDTATIVISATGGVTMTDSEGDSYTQPGTTLTAVADTPYLYGTAGELQDSCWGMFTFRVTTATMQQDVFMTFVNNAVMFSSFKSTYPWSQSNGKYNYYYGVGLK